MNVIPILWWKRVQQLVACLMSIWEEKEKTQERKHTKRGKITCEILGELVKIAKFIMSMDK